MMEHAGLKDGVKRLPWLKVLVALGLAAIIPGLAGCGTGKQAKEQSRGFFTSGSREADQRATQRMAKSEQLAGSGEGAGEARTSKGSSGSEASAATGKPAQAESKTSLFERLGGEKGLAAIINDFMPRALQDPRVNWERRGIKAGGLFHHGPATTWKPTPENVETLKMHLVQCLALATGGPAHYEGKEITTVHADMQIANPEFDAVVGDLKATLDKLKIPNTEQKELLAIVESTRPQIVTKR